MEEVIPDLRVQYSEGGSALRHYSLCVLNLRVVTVAQGLILITGSAVLFRDGLFAAAGLTAIFGIIFALALWAVQRSYWICFDSVLEAVVAIETRGEFGGGALGPWASYAKARKKAYGSLWWTFLVKHVPYLLLWIAFSAILAASVMAETRNGAVTNSARGQLQSRRSINISTQHREGRPTLTGERAKKKRFPPLPEEGD